jgi:hypothetical protein
MPPETQSAAAAFIDWYLDQEEAKGSILEQQSGEYYKSGAYYFSALDPEKEKALLTGTEVNYMLRDKIWDQAETNGIIQGINLTLTT